VRRAALVLALAASADAAELVLRQCDAAVRPPLLWRATVAIIGEAQARAPLRLDLSLEADGRTLASATIPVATLAGLAAGVDVVLAPTTAPPTTVTLLVRAVDVERRLDLRLERHLPTPGSLRAGLERRLPTLASPLDRLHAEQSAELLQADPPSLAAVHRLIALAAPADAQDCEQALVDPLDGSVQPWRLHRPPSAPRSLAVLLRPGRDLRKCDWPPPPPAWLAAAAQAGCLVAEPYPAGDRDGTGILRHRAALVVAAARSQGLDRLPLLVAAAEGLAGAAIAAGLEAPLAAGDLADPASWDPARAAVQPAVPAPGGLAGWFRRPFVVVVGTGEHLAAALEARRLADAFAGAWARHAHGIVPVVADTSYDEARWNRHDLVLVGSPRGNALAARLLSGPPPTALPVRWDERSLQWAAADGSPREALRSIRLPVAISASLATAPGRRVLLLDGAPSWRADGSLPLADQGGDWVVVEPAAPASAAVSR
jgi:hypothetical protein